MTEESLSETQLNVLRFALANSAETHKNQFIDYTPELELKMVADAVADEARSATAAPVDDDGRATEAATPAVEYTYQLLFTNIEFTTLPPNPSIFADVRDNFTWQMKLRVKGHLDTRIVNIPIKRGQTTYPLFESFEITRNYFVEQDKGYNPTPELGEVDFSDGASELFIEHANEKFEYKVYYKYLRREIPRPVSPVDDGPTRSATAPESMFLIANMRTMELHKDHCNYAAQILAENRREVPCEEVELYLYTGYDGCAYCFEEEHYK